MYFISTKASTRLKGYVAPLVLFAFNSYLCKEDRSLLLIYYLFACIME